MRLIAVDFGENFSLGNSRPTKFEVAALLASTVIISLFENPTSPIPQMDFKALSSESFVGLTMALLLVASTVSAKSVPGLSGMCMTPISLGSLYPTPGSHLLALHPMSPTPYSDGSNPDISDCPETPTTVGQADPISVSSTCPYEYITNFDRNRIPASIREARCLCGGCLNPYTGFQSQDLTCEEIKYPVPVLRKDASSPTNGFEMYSLTTEDVTVGCACRRVVAV